MPRLADVKIDAEADGQKVCYVSRAYIDGNGRFWIEIPEPMVELSELQYKKQYYNPIKKHCVTGNTLNEPIQYLRGILKSSIKVDIKKELVICANIKNDMAYAFDEQGNMHPNCSKGAKWKKQINEHYQVSGQKGGINVAIKCYVKTTRTYENIVKYDYHMPSHICSSDNDIWEAWKNSFAEEINAWLLPYPMTQGSFNQNVKDRTKPYECEFPYSDDLAKQVLHAIQMYFKVSHVFSSLFEKQTFMMLPNNSNLLEFLPSKSAEEK